MVDVLIQTFNEEQNLPHTLRSVAGWAGRVFVLDSGSTDATVKIAQEYGARVVHHEWEGYARQKNWALAHLAFESDWILILDADEAVSSELKREILDVVRRPTEQVPECGFMLNRVFVFMGRQIRHCGYFPSWNLRLFQRGKARYEDRAVHEHMICDGPVGKLRHLLVHEDRRGLEHFFAKHNRYSTLEAVEIYQRPEPWPGLRRLMSDAVTRRRFAKSRIMPRLPMPWWWRWMYMYVLRMGFLDGKAGWWLCQFIAHYEFAVQLKLRQLQRTGGAGVLAGESLASAEGMLQPAALPRPAPQQPMPAAEALAAAFAPRGGVGALYGRRDPEAAPTLVERDGGGALFPKGGAKDGLVFVSPWTFRQNLVRAAWMITGRLLFRTSFHNWYGWRRFLLRRFGARIGRDVRIRPTAHIEIPWNIDIDDGAVVGDHAILYSLGRITIGRRAVVSQYAHLCAGTHDYHYRDFPLLRPPITVEEDAWVAADAFVGPNVTIGARSVIGARSSVFKNVPPDVVAVGNPAVPVKRRRIYEDEPAAGATPPLPASTEAPPAPASSSNGQAAAVLAPQDSAPDLQPSPRAGAEQDQSAAPEEPRHGEPVAAE